MSDAAIGAVIVVVLYVVGAVFAGEPAISDEPLPAAVYTHPEPTPRNGG